MEKTGWPLRTTFSVCAAAFAVSYGVWGGENIAGGVESADEAVGWIWSALAASESQTVIGALLAAVTGLVVRWSWVKKLRLEQAVQCISAGVRETYEEYVRETKKASEDGKLTAEERDAAMRMALAKARSYAREKGFDLLKIYAAEFLPVLAERIIGVQKASGRGTSSESSVSVLK